MARPVLLFHGHYEERLRWTQLLVPNGGCFPAHAHLPGTEMSIGLTACVTIVWYVIYDGASGFPLHPLAAGEGGLQVQL